MLRYSLTREEALCRHCPDGVLGNNLVRYWNFSLRVELEPADCNIDCDPIEEERCQWINVLEQEGDTVSGTSCMLDPHVF